MQKLQPKLRFPEFEGDWKLDIIQNLFEFKNGINKEKEFFGKGLPIINFMDVYKNSIITKSNIAGLVELNSSELERFKVKKGDVFFTRTSETILDIGMASSLIEDINNCVFSGFVLRARPIKNVFNPIFTGYLFRTKSIRKEITTKSSMTTRALTSGTLLNKVEFYWPENLKEQTKIASFLTTVDEKINGLKKQLTLLERYKKGVMQKIFSQKLRFKDENGNDFPDWEEKKLGECLDYEQPTPYLVNSTDYDDSFQTPVLTAGKTFILGYTDEEFGIYKNYPVIIFDDFTTASQFVNFSFKAKSSAMKILKVKDSNDIKFLFEAMQMITYETGGHGRHWISVFAQIDILIPTLSEQQKIASFLSAIDEKLENCQGQIKALEKWKKGLLQQMFC